MKINVPKRGMEAGRLENSKRGMEVIDLIAFVPPLSRDTKNLEDLPFSYDMLKLGQL